MMTPAGALVLYICRKRAPKPRRNAPGKRAPWPSPSVPWGTRGAFAWFKASETTYFKMTRNHTRRSPANRDPHP